MNIKRENNKSKQFSGFPKVVAIICIAIILIIITGVVMHKNTEEEREIAVAEMEIEIKDDYEICLNVLNTIKADEFTIGMISTYENNINNADNPAEKFSIAMSMLRFTASELNIHKAKATEGIGTNGTEQGNVSVNYTSLDNKLAKEQSKLIEAKNKIYDI